MEALQATGDVDHDERRGRYEATEHGAGEAGSDFDDSVAHLIGCDAARSP